MLFRRRILALAPLSLAAGLALLLSPRVAPAGPSAEPPAPPAVAERIPDEVRGMWVVRSDLTTPQAVSRVVKHAQANGINTLFVQCRGRADAYYQSTLEPRAPALAKAPAGFDPLARVIEEGRAAGLQVHAWVNACYVWGDSKPPADPSHLVNAHRDWLAVGPTGRRCTIGDKEVFICPGNPEARRHLAQVCADIAARYDVDGIHLDYIRYADGKLCYCNGCLARLEESLAGKVAPEKLAALKKKGRTGLPTGYAWSWKQFRRDQVTALVREVRTAVRSARPEAMLSAAVIAWGRFSGDFKKSDAYNVVGQDWYGWIREGLVDAVCPMTYHADLPSFQTWANGVTRDHPDFPVWFGIAAYLFGPDRAALKVDAVRGRSGKGWVLFSYTAVTKAGTNDAYLKSLKSRVARTASTK
ncbi:MAG: glycoside hydrolase family 10 protein [Armatimonadota bacterium]